MLPLGPHTEQPEAEFLPSARMQGGTHKFRVVAVEHVQGTVVEKVHEEVGAFHEEVPQGSNVTCSQYFFR